MLRDYLRAALERAHYELIDDAEPFYGEVPGLKGVWATGETLGACRDNLESTVEGWLLVRLSRNQDMPILWPYGFCQEPDTNSQQIRLLSWEAEK